MSTYRPLNMIQTYCTNLRSNSLNLVNQLLTSRRSWKLIFCWRKNVVTLLRDSVASMQYAKAPTVDMSGCAELGTG